MHGIIDVSNDAENMLSLSLHNSNYWTISFLFLNILWRQRRIPEKGI